MVAFFDLATYCIKGKIVHKVNFYDLSLKVHTTGGNLDLRPNVATIAHWRHGHKNYLDLTSKCISGDIRNTLYFWHLG